MAAAPHRGQIWMLCQCTSRKAKYRMTRSGILAIAFGATFAVGSAQAETQTEPPERTVWDHNGSIMYLIADGASREIHYQKPRPGMVDAGAHSGSLLFRGRVENGQYLGTAYIFNPQCGPISFEVKGASLDGDERIVLTGQAPRVGRDCRAYGSFTSNLEFRRAKADEAEPAPQAIASKPEVKPDVSVTKGAEVLSAPPGQRLSKNETPSPAQESSGTLLGSRPASSTTPLMPNNTQETKALDKYLWGGAFTIMAVWLLLKLFGKSLIRLK